MAKSKGSKPAAKGSNDSRPNGKAAKKRPKVFDSVFRRLKTKDKN